jgi:hypothetical protein
MRQEQKNHVLNFLGNIILLLFAISFYRLITQIDTSILYRLIKDIDTSDYNKFLITSSVVFFVWYGIAGVLYMISAADYSETETKNYEINNEVFSVTTKTGRVFSGDEEGGKSIFKIWWLLAPIYFACWEEIKSIFAYPFTVHSNLNKIIQSVIIIGSFIALRYSVIILN